MHRSYLALDLGAESGRAILATLKDYSIELKELHRFANQPVRLPGGLYWDTLGLFREMCAGVHKATTLVDQVDGMAVDTWGVDFGLLGSDGALISNPRHYRDERTTGLIEQVCTKVSREEIFRSSGIQFMEINSLYQLYATKRDSPATLAQAAHLLFMPDLFNYFFTGIIAAERTIASTSQFYDPSSGTFARSLLENLDLPVSLLPTLVDPGTPLGPVLPLHYPMCGLRTETMVYTCGSHDTASAIAAVPATGDDWCYISSGTWSLMGVETDQPVINDSSLAANFTNEVGVGGKIRFLKNIPGLWVLQECKREWERSGQKFTYAELMDLAAAAKPMPTVLDLDCFISPGRHLARIAQHCADTSQEAPEGVGATARVVLYSLAVRYKQVLETLETLTGRRLNVIHIVGGGSRNTFLNQLAADVTRRRVVAGPAEATAAGNALTQAMGSHAIRSLDEIRAVVRRSFEVEEFLPRH